MSERLYYDDAYTTEFEAAIVRHTEADGRPAVVLDRTYFYPTSGGQQHDRGVIAGVAVVDVQVTPAGDVLHVLADPLSTDAADGGRVAARIDWTRRFDHMQQHSGQHLLSQAFHRLLGRETLSVHFGESTSSLDLDGDELADEQLAAVEDHANQIVWQNLPIHCYWATDDELDRVPLRRPPQVSGRIRIVEIEQYDWSACGGTHVRRTGEIGAIALLRTERVRGQCRVHFVCGGRAAADYRARRATLDAAAALLDTHHERVPDRVAALQAQNKEQDRAIRSLQDDLLAHRAAALLPSARLVGNDVRLVTRALPDLDPGGLKGLAQSLRGHARTVALLACENNGKGTALFTRSDDVDLDVGRLLREVLRRHGGGGGGGPDFAQGGGMAADRLDAVLADAARAVIAQLAE